MLYIRFMSYVRPQKNITTYRSTTRAFAARGKVQEVSGVPDVVQKRNCFLACFVVLFLDILLNVRSYNYIKRSGKCFSNFVQNFAENNNNQKTPSSLV